MFNLILLLVFKGQGSCKIIGKLIERVYPAIFLTKVDTNQEIKENVKFKKFSNDL